MEQQSIWKKQAAEAAADLLMDLTGKVVGLGTGSTTAFYIEALASRVSRGLRIKGVVCSSLATAKLAMKLGLPIITLDEIFANRDVVKLYVDGADEIDTHFNMIKGGGGAMVREKILAEVAERVIIIADETKRVSRLGVKFPLPVEVIPFALAPVSQQLRERFGASVELRMQLERPVVTDNGNFIIDGRFRGGINAPKTLAQALTSITGLVGTGIFPKDLLFHGTTSGVIVAGHRGVQIFSK